MSGHEPGVDSTLPDKTKDKSFQNNPELQALANSTNDSNQVLYFCHFKVN